MSLCRLRFKKSYTLKLRQKCSTPLMLWITHSVLLLNMPQPVRKHPPVKPRQSERRLFAFHKGAGV